MIKLDHMKKHYGNFELECSMEVREGCITGLIGKNGAGKTTTFKSILGLVRIDGGRAEVFGKSPDRLTERDRERLGVVLAGSGFSGELTVRDYLPVLSAMYHSFDRGGFEEQCHRFSVPMDKKIGEFSTGMQKKLQVLAALSHQAELLILDEPTAGLDVVVRDEILDLLREYMEREGRAILISSHISKDLEGLCDDIYMMDNGKIVMHEDTDVLLSDYGLMKMSKEQYASLDKTAVLRVREEDYGYSCLTDNRSFYEENYPMLVIEKGSIDDVIVMMVRGKEADK